MIALTQIGKTLKTNGIHGWLKVAIQEEHLDYFIDADYIFLDLDGSKVPFKIEDIEATSHILIKLSDVDTETEARTISKQNIWLENIYIVDHIQSGRSFIFEEIIGFTLIDKNSGWSGVVDRISKFPEQEIAHVQNLDSEVLIPLSEYLIINIDAAAGKIYMDLPEGLINLNE